jgi:hypothetical protein
MLEKGDFLFKANLLNPDNSVVGFTSQFLAPNKKKGLKEQYARCQVLIRSFISIWYGVNK